MSFFSQLFDENTFYSSFIKDLRRSRDEVFIESPFVTLQRVSMLKPTLKNLVDKGVRVIILTRRPEDHDENLAVQSELAIQWCEEVGIEVLMCDNNSHRKLAILDRKILWEGSLNILSQSRSREIMRRIEGLDEANQMFRFLKLEKIIGNV